MFCRLKNQTLIFSLALIGFVSATTHLQADDWLRFRGPNGSGISTEKIATPVEFSSSKNLKWKTDMPGAGASGPIVVGDKIFVSCYSGYGETRNNVGKMEDLKRWLVCVNRTDGNVLWKKEIKSYLPEDPFSGMGVPEHGYASSTPVSDGKQVFVFFGKTGVLAFDLDGNEQWQTSVGTKSSRMRWGSAASPILIDDVVIVNASDEDGSLVGLEKSTGKELWRSKGFDSVWGTPAVLGEGENATVVVSVPYEIWGINPSNGKLRWFVTNGIADQSVSSSVLIQDDLVIAMGGQSNTAVAINAVGRNDITKQATLWQGKSNGRIITPLLYEGHLYSINGGIAACFDAKTGNEIYKTRLPGASSGGRGSSEYCSPVIADGKIYQFIKSGTCYVIEAKPEFNLLATNNLDDKSGFNATPAISQGDLFVRSNKSLYCIGNSEQK
jgi:outer membrane protein assembly factor BamB